MSSMHLILHGLVIKKHATADQVATLLGVSASEAKNHLAQAEDEGRIVNIKNNYSLTPLGCIALDNDYSLHYADLRDDQAFSGAYEDFEKINIHIKTLITDWQTIEVGGSSVVNDHSDKDYDLKIIDRLGDLHEKAETILDRLSKSEARMEIYKDHLLTALEKAEDGQTAWVSDASIDSYHTVWFELHEDLLRLLGQERQE